MKEFNIIKLEGVWSLLFNISGFGIDSSTASRFLLKRGKIAATPMVNRGFDKSSNYNYIRLVYSNELAERLTGLCKRTEKALT